MTYPALVFSFFNPFSVKIVRKEGEKEERRTREEKSVRLFLH
jgi:hypothetical protein